MTLDSIMTGQFPVAQFYPAAGVFVMMTFDQRRCGCFDQGGVDAVQALFDAGPPG